MSKRIKKSFEIFQKEICSFLSRLQKETTRFKKRVASRGQSRKKED